MIEMLNESHWPVDINGNPIHGKGFGEVLNDYIQDGWSVLALELATSTQRPDSPFNEHPEWRAILHKADA